MSLLGKAYSQIADAVRNLKDWGVLHPEDIEIVFCDDVNYHMCRAEYLGE